jgi:hypothetical protein
MSDGQIFKPDKDYTKEADQLIPEAQELAKVSSAHPFLPRLADTKPFS